jgi:hypothetical protein
MPRSRVHQIALVACAAAGLACASAKTGGPGVVPSGATSPTGRSDRSVILQEELQNTRETSLYNAIQRIRPDWLRSRGSTSISQGMAGNSGPDAINVYQDLQRLGSIDVLKSMAITQATSLRFYTASEAQMRFGTGNPNGAIQILTAP